VQMGRPRETVKQPKPSRDNQLPGYTGFVQHSKDTFAKTCERHIAFSINSQGDTVGGFATLLQHGAGGGFCPSIVSCCWHVGCSNVMVQRSQTAKQRGS